MTRMPLETLRDISRNGRTKPGESRALAVEMLERMAETGVQCAALRPDALSAIARLGHAYTREAKALALELIERRKSDPAPAPAYDPHALYASVWGLVP